MCGVMFTQPYSEEYAVSFMRVDEIFFLAFVAILVKELALTIT